MSLSSLASVHSATIERVSYTSSSSMGRSQSYSTGNRGSLPTSMSCRVVPISSRKRQEYASENLEVSHVVYTTTDPEVDSRDRIVFGTRHLHVVGTRAPDEMPSSTSARLTHYMVMCREQTGNKPRS